MKSLVLNAIFLVILCSGAYSMIVEMGMYKDPNNPGMCSIDNMILKPGDVITNPYGLCESWTCYEKGQVSKSKCMKQGMRDGCVEGNVRNPNAKFPGCCTREIVCQTGYHSNNFDGK